MPLPPKLTPSQRESIRALRQADPSISYEMLAKRYGVSRNTIREACLATPAAPGATAGQVQEIEHHLLFASPNNPRKTFDDDKINAMAESLAADGQLQNLVAKPANAQGMYEITDGERRWRAAGILIARGAWSKPLSVLVVEGDAARHLAMSLVSALQRENLTALEEADGIAALHAMNPEEWTTAAIAHSIGRSARYVQYRIAIARDLVDPAKILLRRGYITVEAARALAAEPAATQMEVLADYNYNDVTEATEWPDPEDTDYNVATSEIQGSINFIHTRIEREKQLAASAATPAPEPAMRLERAPAAGDEADDDDDNLEPAPPATPAAPELDDNAGPQVTKAHVYHAHARKSQAMQRAVSYDTPMAIRLVCLALLAPQGVVNIRPVPYWSDDDPGEVPELENTVTRLLDGVVPPVYQGDTKAELKLWAQIKKIQGDDLYALFKALVARRVHTPSGPQALLGDSPLAEAIAQTLKIPGSEANHGLTICDEQDLAGLRKPALHAVAEATHTAGITPGTRAADISEAILGRLLNHDYILPTFRFGSSKKIEDALKEMVK